MGRKSWHRYVRRGKLPLRGTSFVKTGRLNPRGQGVRKTTQNLCAGFQFVVSGVTGDTCVYYFVVLRGGSRASLK